MRERRRRRRRRRFEFVVARCFASETSVFGSRKRPILVCVFRDVLCARLARQRVRACAHLWVLRARLVRHPVRVCACLCVAVIPRKFVRTRAHEVVAERVVRVLRLREGVRGCDGALVVGGRERGGSRGRVGVGGRGAAGVEGRCAGVEVGGGEGRDRGAGVVCAEGEGRGGEGGHACVVGALRVSLLFIRRNPLVQIKDTRGGKNNGKKRRHIGGGGRGGRDRWQIKSECTYSLL